MDNHLALFKALERVGARPKGLAARTLPDGSVWWLLNGVSPGGSHAHALIEHAAMVWLVGMDWMISKTHLIPPPSKGNSAVKIADTLVSALLQAVTRECGEVSNDHH